MNKFATKIACKFFGDWRRLRNPIAFVLDDPQAARHQGCMMRCAVTLAPDDATILVTVPEIPYAVTFAVDREDALERGRDAIESALMGAMAAREDIPVPKAQGGDTVTLPALSAAKIELYRAMRAEGVGKAALSQRLGVALPQVDRLLDLRHNWRLDQIERAFAALGRSMAIVVNAA